MGQNCKKNDWKESTLREKRIISNCEQEKWGKKRNVDENKWGEINGLD